MFTILALIPVIVVLICGKIKAALIVLAVTLAVDIVIALVRVGAHLTLEKGVFGLKIIAGPVKLKLLPADKDKPKEPKKTKKEKAEEPEEEKEEPEKEKSGIHVTLELVTTVLKAVGELLGRFRRKITVDSLTIHYTAASPDPYNTAMTFAYASAGVNALMPVIHNIFTVKKSDVGAAVTFDAQEADVYVDARLTLAVWEVIYIVLAVWPVIRVILAQLLKKGKVDNHGQASDQ